MVPVHENVRFVAVREILPGALPLSDDWDSQRFDRGMESKLSLELWAGTAPTRKGNAARATVMEKCIYEIERSN